MIILLFLGITLSNIWYSSAELDLHCFDSTCGVKIDDWELSPNTENCTDIDIGYEYSSCNDKANTRSLFPFWKPPGVCLGASLPAPIYGISCDLKCKPGTRLHPKNFSTCSGCLPGRFSEGGQINFGPPWEKIPAQFVSECSSTAGNCDAWDVRDEYLDSGNNYKVKGTQSLLTLQFTLRTEGTLEFEYKFHARDHLDVFGVGIDSVIPQGGVWWTRVDTWKTFKIKISKGHHLVRWFYRKDKNTQGNGGPDRAYLRSISISGMSYGDASCKACPPGKYSRGNASKCTLCPGNTKAVGEGNSECIPCGSMERSFPGSSYCQSTIPCNISDYHSYIIQPCNSTGYQKIAFDWLVPISCNLSSGVKLPGVKIEKCSLNCPKGHTISLTMDNNQPCIPCQKGYMSAEKNANCTPCSKGTFANEMVFYQNIWDSENLLGWKSFCEGHCGTKNGWRFGPSVIDSGTNHGNKVDLILDLTLQSFQSENDVRDFMQVEFDYSISCQSFGTSLQFKVNEINVWEIQCQSNNCNQDIKTVKLNFTSVNMCRNFGDNCIELPGPWSKFNWIYRKFIKENQQQACDQAKIYSVKMTGIGGEQGASICSECGPGTISSKDANWECTPCMAGTMAHPTASKCIPCPPNKFSPFEGASSCYSCGVGSQVNDARTGCIIKRNISFDLPPQEYELLSGISRATLFDDNKTFYINLFDPIEAKTQCQKQRENCLDSSDCDSGRCQTDGSFSPRQCNLTEKHCWCVDGTGRKIPNVNDDPEIFLDLDCEEDICNSEACCNNLVALTAKNKLPTPRICVKSYQSFPKAISMGSIFSSEPFPVSERNEIRGLRLKFTEGSPCESDPLKALSTVVDWKCPDNRASFASIKVVKFENCVLYLEWYSIYACPKCTNRDYTTTTSSCKETMAGDKEVTWSSWNQPKMCRGGILLPSSIGVDCEIEVPIKPNKKVVKKNSTVVSRVFLLLIILLGVGILLAGVLVAYCIHKQIHDIRKNYSALKVEIGDDE